MANTKKIQIAHSETGITAYCIVRRETDNYRLNDADGAFASNPADPYLSLTEDSIIKGLYEVSENRTVWTDGRYIVTVYKLIGGSPVPASDVIIGGGEININDDLEVILDVATSNLQSDIQTLSATTNDIETVLNDVRNEVDDIWALQVFKEGKFTVTGNIFYVDGVNGSDSNPGTKQSPFATIGKGILSCVSGNHDAVIVYGKSTPYNEQLVLDKKIGSVVIVDENSIT